jgi:hypothetical protein
MHATLHLLVFWALAFVTLAAAIVLLNIFDGLIGNDLYLHSAGKEGLIAAVASFIEGGSLWLVVTFVPLAGRALFVPALIVALLYKVSHLEDWSRYDVTMLLLFQGVLVGIVVSLYAGQYTLALAIVVVFAFALAVIAGFVRGL